MTDRQDIVTEARTWLGVRWRHQGRTRFGIDCVGLIVVVGRELGLLDYDFGGYGRRPDKSFMSHFETNGTRVPRADRQAGDVAIFKDQNYPCHVGLFGSKADRLTVIHARAPKKVVEEYFANELANDLVAVYRFKEVMADG